MFNILLVTIAFPCISRVQATGNAPTVQTSLGTIIGSTTLVKGNRINQYLSVPYAKPPTGELRFRKPVLTEAWSEPLIATNVPPACIQYTQNPFPWYDDGPDKSENCLFLNIWTPSNADHGNKKAVLYWIFGGGFFVGSIRQKFHLGDVLSALGDIIVVTVSYRLGSLGFLYSGSDEAPGNVGLWDILAGLQWVNDHIGTFGGDISRITIAGESAGSISVGLLSVSPLAHSLYTRQVMQSGSPAYTIADNSTQQNMARSQKIAELVSCANSSFTIEAFSKEVVDCLRSVNAMEIIQAESSLIPHSSRSFLPQYGDEILPKNARQAIIDRDFHNGDVLIGNSKDEGSFQITTSNPDIFGFFGEKNTQINKSEGEAILRRIFSAFPDTEGLVRHYLPEDILEDDCETVRRQLYSASGDFSLLCPTVYYAEKIAENHKVYYYLWTHRPNTTPWAPWMGAPHFSEVEFLFGLPIKDPKTYSSDEVGLSMDFIHKWSNFAKHGKPMENWPLYSKDKPEFLYYGLGTEINGTGPYSENCDFFRPFIGF